MSKLKFLAAVALVGGMTPAVASAMLLKVDGLGDSLRAHLNEVPQCSDLRFEVDQPIGDRGWFFTIKNKTSIDVVVRRDGDQVESIEAVSADRNQQALEDMMCLTIAMMRTIQPDLIETSEAIEEASNLWTGAKDKPFRKAFFFDTSTAKLPPLVFTAKLTPLMFTVE